MRWNRTIAFWQAAGKMADALISPRGLLSPDFCRNSGTRPVEQPPTVLQEQPAGWSQSTGLDFTKFTVVWQPGDFLHFVIVTLWGNREAWRSEIHVLYFVFFKQIIRSVTISTSTNPHPGNVCDPQHVTQSWTVRPLSAVSPPAGRSPNYSTP